MTCAICGEKFYQQTEIDPEESCGCGECAWDIETWRDRVKWLRWRLAMACFTAGDKIIKWGPS